MIQPLPQECGVRRAFPAITGRGRGWCANGFNYHSDRNTGRQGPARVTARTARPGPLVPGTPTRSPAPGLGGGRRSTAGPHRATRGHTGSGSQVSGEPGAKAGMREWRAPKQPGGSPTLHRTAYGGGWAWCGTTQGRGHGTTAVGRGSLLGAH